MVPKDTKSDEQKSERFNMFMSPTEMKAIDEWAWENRIRSKSEAVRRLVQIGLAYDKEAGSAREYVRTTIKLGLTGMDSILEVAQTIHDERAYDLLQAVEAVQQSVGASISLFQDMAATDETAEAMEEVGEFSDKLRKAEEAKARIDARRKP